MKRILAVLLVALALSPAAASAQRAGLALGYSSMPGRIGERDSDHGVALRLGVDLAGGSRLTWGLEGGVDRLNGVHRQYSTDCVLPGGAIGTCFFDERSRDTGWSLGTLLRLHAGPPRARPYLLVGLGLLTVRNHVRTEVVDGSGNPLPNFSSKGNYGDDALQGHLGAGVTLRPSGLPVGLTVEGRATRLINNYSGGFQGNWNPSITVGVKTGG